MKKNIVLFVAMFLGSVMAIAQNTTLTGPKRKAQTRIRKASSNRHEEKGKAIKVPVKEKYNSSKKDEQVFRLNGEADSLSYFAGYILTNGLQDHLHTKYGVEPTSYEDFLQGYSEFVVRNSNSKSTDQTNNNTITQIDIGNSPQAKAQSAGAAIAQFAIEHYIPNIKDLFEYSSDSLNESLLHKGFADAIRSDSHLTTLKEAMEYYDYHIKILEEQRDNKWRQNNINFLTTNKAEEGVITTPSGLQYKILIKGTGAIPTKD